MLSSLVEKLSHDPFNQELNFKVALEYDRLNQTASAVSFYQRTAEYGTGLYVYNSLLKMSQCFERQGDREATVMQNALQAVALMPNRPEAYFRVAQLHERHKRWNECYTWAEMGLSFKSDSTLPHFPEYYGDYVLEFEKAVAGWWIGRKEESNRIFFSLLRKDIAPEYKKACEDNLERTGVEVDVVNPLEPVVMNYRKFFANKSSLVIDIGTRDGKDAAYLARQLKASTTYAVDANPVAIVKTKNAYPWMKVIQSAVSDFDGETTFQQVNSGNENMDGCSSLYAEKVATEPQFDGKVNVITTPVKRMDTLMAEENISSIDIAKIDVEGFTYQVLEGFGDKIKNVKIFHLETEKEATHPEHRNTEAITQYMRDKGFVLVDVSYDGSNGINGGIEDQVWVNPSLAERNKDYFTYRQTTIS